MAIMNPQPQGYQQGLHVADSAMSGYLSQLTRKSQPVPETCTGMLEGSIEVYYRTIHRSHPFIIPYKEYLDDRSTLPMYLKKCMAYAASPYTSGDEELSRQNALEILDSILPQNVFRVQALLLVTITSYAHCERDTGNQALELALSIATRLGLGSESSIINAKAVQRESHRRTWWQLFTIATMVSLVSGLEFKIEIDTSRRLLCEENVYESCSVEECGTLDGMQARYFLDSDTSWSSFAYLVEAVCLLRQVLNSRQEMLFHHSPKLRVENLDAALSAFALSVPPEKQQILNVDGEHDEVMLMAHMFINIAGMCLHSPLSTFSVLSSFGTFVCGNEHSTPRWTDQATRSYHTVRAIKSAQTLTKLIVGRTDFDTLTPCFSCGLAFSSSTLLNAAVVEDDDIGFGTKDMKELIKFALTVLKRTGKSWPIANMVRFQLAKQFNDISAPNIGNDDLSQGKLALDITIETPSISPDSDFDPSNRHILDDIEHDLGFDKFLNSDAMESLENALPI